MRIVILEQEILVFRWMEPEQEVIPVGIRLVGEKTTRLHTQTLSLRSMFGIILGTDLH